MAQTRLERLYELSHLTDGWHDGEGLAIGPKAMESAAALLALNPAFVDKARIYPGLEGSVLFEFDEDGTDVTIEMHADGSIAFHSVALFTAEERTATFESLDALLAELGPARHLAL